MDGGTNPKQILAFQKWTNKFKFKEKKIAEDGKWGPKTSAAWKQFGGDYMSAGAAVSGIMDSFSKLGQGGSSDNSEPKEKVGLFDKIGNLFGKAKDVKSKAEELKGKGQDILGKARDLKNKVGGMGSGGGFDSEMGSSDEPTASKSKTGKIILWSAVGLTVLIVAGYLIKKAKA
jgi:hypothetical protein